MAPSASPSSLYKDKNEIIIIYEKFEDTKRIVDGQSIQRPTRHIIMYKTLHRKLKIQHYEPQENQSEFMCLVRISSTSDTCSVTTKQYNHHVIWRSCFALVYLNKHKLHK